MNADVPRRASFDDLRVGQWVAWCWNDGPLAGSVERTSTGEVIVRGQDTYSFLPRDVASAEVTILRDAPAPPVTVRREDYDALVRVQRTGQPDPERMIVVWNLVRDLIDNAEVDQ